MEWFEQAISDDDKKSNPEARIASGFDLSYSTHMACDLVASATTTATATAAAVATAATAAVTTTTSAAVSTTASTARAGTFFARASFVDRQRAACQLGAVQTGDGCLSAIVHFDEGKATTASGFPVGDNLCPQHSAELRERLDEVVAGGLEGNVPNIQFLTHNYPH
jgi:hypothetical protein